MSYAAIVAVVCVAYFFYNVAVFPDIMCFCEAGDAGAVQLRSCYVGDEIVVVITCYGRYDGVVRFYYVCKGVKQAVLVFE